MAVQKNLSIQPSANALRARLALAVGHATLMATLLERLSEKFHLLHPSPLNPPILGDF
ncbi:MULTISPECIES: hypothetical protein [unclassified Moorena]|uniref:hypothetical protein n=1 Tax=unclassified Moorena TaxID=2683338 RepID=UPI0013BDCDB0|nr:MULTISPECIES: hypothetical protein [unclassified Moorena]NER85961.1 hypothetical protein [Moorena sp. SIO3A2]NET64313.1 hypothetical protein [Moorena sp. SIO1G6]